MKCSDDILAMPPFLCGADSTQPESVASWGSLDVSMEAPIGPIVPGYRVVEPLGEGGMASVWLARRDGHEEPCVVKTLRPDVERKRASRMRFLREVVVTKRLNHPNIARTYDAGQSSHGRYLAMEYIPGCDLKAVVERWSDRQMPAGLSAAIAFRVLEALDYAHNLPDADGEPLGIVHRDLTLRNIMVTFDGQVKLIDFGLVRTKLGSFRTEPGMIAGTARYMSPEQATARDIDARSDLYTLGAVLYELLTGQPAAGGTFLNEILRAVVKEEPAAPSTVNPMLSPEIDAVLLKALQKRPEDRFQTARAFKVALRAALKGIEIPRAGEIGSILRALFAEEYMASLERFADGAVDDTISGADVLNRPMDIVPPREVWAPLLQAAGENDDTVRSRPPPRAPAWSTPDAPRAEEEAPTWSTPNAPQAEQKGPTVEPGSSERGRAGLRAGRGLLVGVVLGAVATAASFFWALPNI